MTSAPSVTLQTAVLIAVKEFATQSRTFSIHDITKSIRAKCNSGELEIPEVEVTGGGQFRFEVEHDKVKELFLELLNTGAFDADFSLTEQFNRQGGFRTYTPSSVNGAISVASPTTVNVPVATVTTPAAAPVATPAPIDSDVQDRINKYLTNCRNRNFRPSLRQVQSAIKRGERSTGYTVEALRDFISGLGYQFSVNPSSLAKYQVVV